ncbi:M1 family metallopeptidase [Modestobacter marinus]|uniref:M1 family metallopeptidase n=1 Tax=Modestobacter marinus TaxID=477641 RepID=UPI001C98164F|nr:M1 family metallopeptidase [Modestobacter marinus]
MVRRRLVLLPVTAVAVALLPGTAVAAPGDEPVPGAPGLGDPYYPLDGNGGYDVDHYDLRLRYDPATDELTATATIEAAATQPLSSFNLDLQGLTVSAVTVEDDDATWTRDGGELTITPAEPLEEGQDVTTVITYSGVPATLPDVSGFLHTDDGAVVAGQPDGAATWFPANDHPLDPATVTVTATVPEGLEAISNGALEEQSTADGWTTWRWDAAEPMATYLVTLAIGEFDVREYEADGVRYWDALDPDLFTPVMGGPPRGEIAAASLARQPEVIDWLSDWLGDYPFGTAGGIVDDDAALVFALETQTRPVYSPLYFTDQLRGDVVVVHELAHQWTGDLVRIAAWQHLWLNEGFATYAEWLWLERAGVRTAQQSFDQLAALPPESPLWEDLPGDPGPALEDLFSAAVYNRGAMTLHALRSAVGEDVFARLVREWVSAQAGEAVTTADFTALAEEVSGQELDELFQTWLFTPGKPAGLGAAPAAQPSAGTAVAGSPSAAAASAGTTVSSR